MKKLIFSSLMLLCGAISVQAQTPERVEFDWLYWDETNATPHKGYAEIESPDGKAANLSIFFLNEQDGDAGLIVREGFDYKANLKVTALGKSKQVFGPCYYLPQESSIELPSIVDRFWIKLDKKTKGDVTMVQVEKRQSGRLMGRPRVILSKADDVMALVAHAVESLNLNLLN